MKIRKFRDREPALPFRWKGVELQFYERFEEADDVEMKLDEESQEIEVIILRAYKEYLLPWREEFSQREVLENDVVIQEDYVCEHLEELSEEAKMI